MAKEKFADAKVGDRVYDVRFGEGKIVKIHENGNYPVGVKFPTYSKKWYTLGGHYLTVDKNPSLMHNFGMGKKVLVWNNDGDEKIRQFFRNWEKNGRAVCFPHLDYFGFVEAATRWNFCEPLVEE